MPRRLQVSAAIGWRVLVLAGCAWLLLKVLAIGSHVIIPIGIAVLLTALLAPISAFLVQRAHFPRYLAAAVTLVGALLLVIGLVALASNSLLHGVGDVRASFSGGLDQFQRWLADGPLELSGDQISAYLAQARDWVQKNHDQLTSGVMQVGNVTIAVVTGSLLALVSTLFFLADGQKIWRWCVALLPQAHRGPVHEASRRGWLALGSYIRTQIIVAAVDAAGIALGAWILGLPFVLPIAVIVFIASLIPIVGAVGSGALVVVVALVDQGLVAALIMLGVVLLVQQVESHLLQPILMSRAVNIHPWAVIIGVALGSFLMGIVGALFAVPIMALANTVARYLTGSDPFPTLGTSPAPEPDRTPEDGTSAPKTPWWKRFFKRPGGSTAPADQPSSAEQPEKSIATDPS